MDAGDVTVETIEERVAAGEHLIVLFGTVYKLSEEFVDSGHPGGKGILQDAVGALERSQAFVSAHGNWEEILQKIDEFGCERVGKLKGLGGSAPSMQEMLSGGNDETNKGTHKTVWLNDRELGKIQNVLEMEQVAQRRMAKSAFTYIAYGCEDLESIQINKSGWKDLKLRPRVARNVANADISLKLDFLLHDGKDSVINLQFPSPIFVAPFVGSRLCDPSEGELAISNICKERNVLYTAPFYAGTTIEEIGAGNNLFQLYWSVSHDEEFFECLVGHLCNIGFKGIVLTLDSPTFGNREKTYQSNEWIEEIKRECGGMPKPIALQGKGMKVRRPNKGNSQTLSWKDISWLRKLCNKNQLLLFVKGIMNFNDAKLAADAGVQGIIVSNHGGRQLDGTVSTALAAFECIEALKRHSSNSSCKIFVDGGIRRGKDVFRALALGCDGVFIGRPVAYGLGAASSRGVKKVLDILDRELTTQMMLCGCQSISDVRDESNCFLSHNKL